MNIFRILGTERKSLDNPCDEGLPLIADLSHLVSILILLQKMKSSHVRSPQ